MLENRKKISFSTSVLNCIPHHVVNIIYFGKRVKESNSKKKKYFSQLLTDNSFKQKLYQKNDHYTLYSVNFPLADFKRIF